MGQTGFTGIAFPFNFSSGGSTQTSTTDENDFSHIEEEITQRLLTRKGERINNPDYGSEIHKCLFGNQDEDTEALVIYYTQQALAPMSDRIEVLSVDVEYDEEDLEFDGKVYITLDIFVTKYMTGDKFTVTYNAGGAM